MKLVVDLTRCQGYAQCAFLDPSAFTIHGDEALLYDPEPGDEQRERVLRAAAACPVQALVLDRVGGRNGAPQADAAGRGEARRSGADGGFLRSGRIVIVGASLAGLRAAEALRHEGFTGSLTLIGDEPHEPYDRPPLSKQVLEGWVAAGGTGLPRRDDVEAQWRLGVAAYRPAAIPAQPRAARPTPSPRRVGPPHPRTAWRATRPQESEEQPFAQGT